MFAVDLLQRFRASRFGWLNPSGELIVCKSFGHVEALGKQDRYEQLYQESEDAMEEELASLEPDEHPALHRFDSSGDARRGVMLEAYNEGWVRLGLWADQYAKLEAISALPALTAQIERIKFITDVLGCELVVRDQYDKKLKPKDRQKLGVR